jgi:mitochondrial fission protein ELM1
VVALAEALGLPFEVKQLRYRVPASLWLPFNILRGLLPGGRSGRAVVLNDDPPDLTISVGVRSVEPVRHVRRRSRAKTQSVHLGSLRASPSLFDLVISTPQYVIEDTPSVVRIPLALGIPAKRVPLDETAQEFLDGMVRPRRLLLLGGPTDNWELVADDVTSAIATLLRSCETKGGSLIVLGSPRTPAEVFEATRQALAKTGVPAALVPTEGPPRYAQLLDAADEFFVTADSVSMISETLRTGKPVGLVPIRPSQEGAKRIAEGNRERPGQRIMPRDLRFFWAELERLGLVGTVAEPRAGEAPDTLAIAAGLVRRLLGLSPRRASP